MRLSAYIFLLSLSCLFLSGCDDDLPLSTICQSQWYKKQIEVVRAPKKNFLDPERSLWCGKIVSVHNGIVTLKPFRKLAGFSNVKNDSLVLWFADNDTANLSAGTWLVTRTERSWKDQYFVQEYRSLTQGNSVPEKFAAIYKKIMLAAIEHDWHLKVEVLEKEKMLKITNGTPKTTKFYASKFINGYTSTRTRDDVFFSGNVFEYIIRDTKGITFDRIRLQNTPGGMVWEKDENDLWHIFRCGYDFNSEAFQEITGEYPTVSMSKMIRFPLMSESSGFIAMHSSTKAQREALQNAFDKSGIPGEWKIGNLGSMIFYSDCREFELDMPWIFHDKAVKVSGPHPSGFIFSLSTPHSGAAAITCYSHPPVCDCPSFYYWKTIRGPGYIAWNRGDNMVWHTWNFEFGDQLSNHPEVLAKILKTIQSLPAWTLPKSK